MKHCHSCATDKPLSAFCKDKSKSDGLRAICRQCDAFKGKRYMQTDAGKVARSRANRSRRLRAPDRVNVGWQVQNAIERGDLVRQPCEVCGKLPTEAHHDDYSKPLLVRWLCQFHHRQHHQSLKTKNEN